VQLHNLVFVVLHYYLTIIHYHALTSKKGGPTHGWLKVECGVLYNYVTIQLYNLVFVVGPALLSNTYIIPYFCFFLPFLPTELNRFNLLGLSATLQLGICCPTLLSYYYSWAYPRVQLYNLVFVVLHYYLTIIHYHTLTPKEGGPTHAWLKVEALLWAYPGVQLYNIVVGPTLLSYYYTIP